MNGAENYRGAICDGCGLPITSCVCSATPWGSLTPAYVLNVETPPAFWRKKDRDEWVASVYEVNVPRDEPHHTRWGA